MSSLAGGSEFLRCEEETNRQAMLATVSPQEKTGLSFFGQSQMRPLIRKFGNHNQQMQWTDDPQFDFAPISFREIVIFTMGSLPEPNTHGYRFCQKCSFGTGPMIGNQGKA